MSRLHCFKIFELVFGTCPYEDCSFIIRAESNGGAIELFGNLAQRSSFLFFKI